MSLCCGASSQVCKGTGGHQVFGSRRWPRRLLYPYRGGLLLLVRIVVDPNRGGLVLYLNRGGLLIDDEVASNQET